MGETNGGEGTNRIHIPYIGYVKYVDYCTHASTQLQVQKGKTKTDEMKFTPCLLCCTI